jgi:hypothetical protein
VIQHFVEGEHVYKFDASKESRIGLLPRYAKNESQIRWFTIPTCMIFHLCEYSIIYWCFIQIISNSSVEGIYMLMILEFQEIDDCKLLISVILNLYNIPLCNMNFSCFFSCGLEMIYINDNILKYFVLPICLVAIENRS